MDFSARVKEVDVLAVLGPSRYTPTIRSLGWSIRILAAALVSPIRVVEVPAAGVAVAHIDIDALVPSLSVKHPHSGELGIVFTALATPR